MKIKCDIIIPVWNQFALTKDCVESVLSNTAPGYGLVIVDNGSGAETKSYLESLGGKKDPAIRVLRNESNTGFIKAANQGIRASSAPFVCLLNNDTLVTKGWLEEMIAVAESADDIGIVNPSSNNLGQKPVDGEPLELYAEKMRMNKGRCSELGAAIGFCMLIKRGVIDRVGVLDEIYGMGNFEDTDFSRNAVKSGFRCVRACGAYVYHRENSSFRKHKNFDYDFKRNKEIFEFRWGRPRRVAYVIERRDLNELKKIGAESLKSARSGNRIWYFSKKRLVMPEHSNIMRVELGDRYFYVNSIFNILKKKKKFDEIFVSDAMLGRILEALRFIHNAKINYY